MGRVWTWIASWILGCRLGRLVAACGVGALFKRAGKPSDMPLVKYLI